MMGGTAAGRGENGMGFETFSHGKTMMGGTAYSPRSAMCCRVSTFSHGKTMMGGTAPLWVAHYGTEKPAFSHGKTMMGGTAR